MTANVQKREKQKCLQAHCSNQNLKVFLFLTIKISILIKTHEAFDIFDTMYRFSVSYVKL